MPECPACGSESSTPLIEGSNDYICRVSSCDVLTFSRGDA